MKTWSFSWVGAASSADIPKDGPAWFFAGGFLRQAAVFQRRRVRRGKVNFRRDRSLVSLPDRNFGSVRMGQREVDKTFDACCKDMATAMSFPDGRHFFIEEGAPKL